MYQWDPIELFVFSHLLMPCLTGDDSVTAGSILGQLGLLFGWEDLECLCWSDARMLLLLVWFYKHLHHMGVISGATIHCHSIMTNSPIFPFSP